MKIIHGGRVIDPEQNIDRVCDVVIRGTEVVEVTPKPLIVFPESSEIIDASDLIVSPGFIDVHTHLRDPGFEWKETIASGGIAAARGGFTTVCAMPNTDPPQDSARAIEDLIRRSATESPVRVLPIGAITKGRLGTSLAPLGEMADCGAIGFSDDGDPVSNTNIMRQALSYAKDIGLPIINHAEDKALVGDGVMNEGEVATRLGLPGIPSQAESIMIARDLLLAELTGGRLHIPHVSTKESVSFIREAKARGVNVTAEVTPHHLVLDDRWVYGAKGDAPKAITASAYDTNTKVNPPLRSTTDVIAVIDGLVEGTIDMVATDHAPHAKIEKICTFNDAAHGINGLETAFGQIMKLVHADRLPLNTAIERMTAAPASLLKMKIGSLKKKYPADLVIFGSDIEWTVESGEFSSKSTNTPLIGTTLKGRVVYTMRDGTSVYGAISRGDSI